MATSADIAPGLDAPGLDAAGLDAEVASAPVVAAAAVDDRVAALSVRGLTKRFGDVLASSDLDMDFYRSEVHAVLGENGRQEHAREDAVRLLSPG
jgi:hypothetical protein